MKVGDLVKLSTRKTRKGMPYDNTIGVVTLITSGHEHGLTLVVAIFAGDQYTFSLSDLRVISEGR